MSVPRGTCGRAGGLRCAHCGYALDGGGRAAMVEVCPECAEVIDFADPAHAPLEERFSPGLFFSVSALPPFVLTLCSAWLLLPALVFAGLCPPVLAWSSTRRTLPAVGRPVRTLGLGLAGSVAGVVAALLGAVLAELMREVGA